MASIRRPDRNNFPLLGERETLEPMRRLAAIRHFIAFRSLGVLALGWFAVSGVVGQTATSAPQSADTRPASAAGDYLSRPEVQRFIDYMVAQHQFDVNVLREYFAEARHQPRVVSLMTPAPSGARRSWAQYRTRVVDPYRVEMGLAFWRAHREPLREASERFGVPEEIIVAIIGIETNYGRVTGTFRVFDTLVTLSFDYLRRAEFFKGELEQFLLWIRDNRLDVMGPHGSYAGAIGIPQFLPGSIRRHAIDLDGDGRVDLSRNPADAIGSVANFLANHGWQRGAPTHFAAAVSPSSGIDRFVQAGIEPQFKIAELEQAGVRSAAVIPQQTPLALIEFPNGDQPSQHILAAPNFYVITRYNRSSFYAMAVIELAEKLRTDLAARTRAPNG